MSGVSEVDTCNVILIYCNNVDTIAVIVTTCHKKQRARVCACVCVRTCMRVCVLSRLTTDATHYIKEESLAESNLLGDACRLSSCILQSTCLADVSTSGPPVRRPDVSLVNVRVHVCSCMQWGKGHHNGCVCNVKVLGVILEEKKQKPQCVVVQTQLKRTALWQELMLENGCPEYTGKLQ